VLLTDEQRAIVESDAPLLKINAVAGSGKTTTLLEYAARRPERRILYLAYNRAIANEVKVKCRVRSLTHVTVHTIHGLAYRHANGSAYALESELSEWRILERYCPAEEASSEEAMLIGWLIKDLVNYYLNAEYTRLDEGLLSRYEAASTPKIRLREILHAKGLALVEVARAILSDMKNKVIPAVHDFYLKLFQFSRSCLPFDVLLVDEAQDTSEVMLSIVNQQPADKVFVGDSFQQIYSFRYAVNSLDRIEGYPYWLHQTFRFGNGLARHITGQVNGAYALLDEQKTITIQGTNERPLFGRRAQPGYPRAIIARSNLALFETCLQHTFGSDLRFYFEGGYSGYSFMNARVASLLYLREGRKERIIDPFVRRFASFEKACYFAGETQNNSLATMIQLVTQYGRKLFEFDRIIKQRLVEKDRAECVFATTHKAKGQEYDHVEMVEEDFITREGIKWALRAGEDKAQLLKLREEINIYYVAATRARKSIRLASF
jgi:superfamily I DNA/RNA helicase